MARQCPCYTVQGSWPQNWSVVLEEDATNATPYRLFCVWYTIVSAKLAPDIAPLEWYSEIHTWISWKIIYTNATGVN